MRSLQAERSVTLPLPGTTSPPTGERRSGSAADQSDGKSRNRSADFRFPHRFPNVLCSMIGRFEAEPRRFYSPQIQQNRDSQQSGNAIAIPQSGCSSAPAAMQHRDCLVKERQVGSVGWGAVPGLCVCPANV